MSTSSIIIYKVTFVEPPYEVSDVNEFYYSSIAAIYEDFSTEEIGCGAQRLYQLGLREGMPYRNKRCCITRHFCASKRKTR